jgi:hypothetical protein
MDEEERVRVLQGIRVSGAAAGTWPDVEGADPAGVGLRLERVRRAALVGLPLHQGS